MGNVILVDARVKKRGFNCTGTVMAVSGKWVAVKWDDGHAAKERPKICHEAELALEGVELPPIKRVLDWVA